MSVVLYHHPGSLCSQKVRLALAEKRVAYEARVIDIGPRCENFEPWYVRLNAKAVVPTLVHDDKPVTDSARIIRYIDETFNGPPLSAAGGAARKTESEWIDIADRLPIRELSYGTVRPPFGWILRRSDGTRLKKLKKHLAENPDLREAYEAKIEDVQTWFATARDRAQVGEIKANVEAVLDKLDAHLEGRPFVGGERYGVADVLWTVVIARLCALGMRKQIESRASVSAYFERMKARKSFNEAGILDRISLSLVLRSLFGRHDRKAA